MKNIRQNLFLAFAYNAIGVPASAPSSTTSVRAVLFFALGADGLGVAFGGLAPCSG